MPPHLVKAADARAMVERRSRSWVVSEAVAAFTEGPIALDEAPEIPARGTPDVTEGDLWIQAFDAYPDYLAWRASRGSAPPDWPFRTWLTRLCRALNEQNARYVVVGSAALRLLAVRRTHSGMEILIHPSRKSARRVLRALASLGGDLASDELAEGVAGRAATVFGKEPRADVLTVAGGLSWDEATQQAATILMEGVEVPVASIGDVLTGGAT